MSSITVDHGIESDGLVVDYVIQSPGTHRAGNKFGLLILTGECNMNLCLVIARFHHS